MLICRWLFVSGRRGKKMPEDRFSVDRCEEAMDDTADATVIEGDKSQALHDASPRLVQPTVNNEQPMQQSPVKAVKLTTPQKECVTPQTSAGKKENTAAVRTDPKAGTSGITTVEVGIADKENKVSQVVKQNIALSTGSNSSTPRHKETPRLLKNNRVQVRSNKQRQFEKEPL